ncbi:DUF2267 domain-containing protein [bacterium]|nr:DUF2267 domain-containing protein [bacterium]
MQYQEFMDKVKKKIRFENEEDCLRTVRAVLATLGERLPSTERRRLTTQLPKELEEFFHERLVTQQIEEHGDRYSLEEFYNRVGARAGILHGESVKKAKAVLSVLQEAVSQGEMQDVREVLPDDFRELFSPS